MKYMIIFLFADTECMGNSVDVLLLFKTHCKRKFWCWTLFPWKQSHFSVALIAAAVDCISDWPPGLFWQCYCFACVVSQYQELSEGRGTYEYLYKPVSQHLLIFAVCSHFLKSVEPKSRVWLFFYRDIVGAGDGRGSVT